MENNNRTWEALSMKDRASFIKLAVQNGYKDVGSIRSLYNKYDDGGPTKDSAKLEYVMRESQGTSGNIFKRGEREGLIKAQKALNAEIIPEDRGYSNDLAYTGALFTNERYHPDYNYDTFFNPFLADTGDLNKYLGYRPVDFVDAYVSNKTPFKELGVIEDRDSGEKALLKKSIKEGYNPKIYQSYRDTLPENTVRYLDSQLEKGIPKKGDNITLHNTNDDHAIFRLGNSNLGYDGQNITAVHVKQPDGKIAYKLVDYYDFNPDQWSAPVKPKVLKEGLQFIEENGNPYIMTSPWFYKPEWDSKIEKEYYSKELGGKINKFDTGGPTNDYNAVLYNGKITAPIEEISITGNSGLTHYKPGTKEYINQIRKYTNRIYNGDLAIDAVPQYYRKGVENTIKGDQFATNVRRGRDANYKGLMTAMNAIPLSVGAASILPAGTLANTAKVIINPASASTEAGAIAATALDAAGTAYGLQQNTQLINKWSRGDFDLEDPIWFVLNTVSTLPYMKVISPYANAGINTVVNKGKKIIEDVKDWHTINKAFKTGTLEVGNPSTFMGYHQSDKPITTFEFPFERWDVVNHNADPNGAFFTLNSPAESGFLSERPYTSVFKITSNKPLIQHGEILSNNKKNNLRNKIIKKARKIGADSVLFDNIADNQLQNQQILMSLNQDNIKHLTTWERNLPSDVPTINLPQYSNSSTRELVKEFNLKFNKRYGYEPFPLDIDFNTYKNLVKERLDRHNTFLRGVSDPFSNDNRLTNEEVSLVADLMRIHGFNPSSKRDRLLFSLQYNAPNFKNYGRANLPPRLYADLSAIDYIRLNKYKENPFAFDKDLGPLHEKHSLNKGTLGTSYASNSDEIGSGYAYSSDGMVALVRRPYELSDDPKQWRFEGDFDLAYYADESTLFEDRMYEAITGRSVYSDISKNYNIGKAFNIASDARKKFFNLDLESKDILGKYKEADDLGALLPNSNYIVPQSGSDARLLYQKANKIIESLGEVSKLKEPKTIRDFVFLKELNNQLRKATSKKDIYKALTNAARETKITLSPLDNKKFLKAAGIDDLKRELFNSVFFDSSGKRTTSSQEFIDKFYKDRNTIYTNSPLNSLTRNVDPKTRHYINVGPLNTKAWDFVEELPYSGDNATRRHIERTYNNKTTKKTRALGGPLYNQNNPIESFQGNPYIPVVRYKDGGEKISTKTPTSLYTWHSFDNIGKSKDFVYNYLLHNKPKLGEHADKILEDTLNTIDSINFENKYIQEGVATGNYDPFTNTVIRQRFDFDDPTFYVHEIGHATNKRIPDYKSDFPKDYHDYYKDLIEDKDRHPITKNIDDLLNNYNYKDPYWDRPTEVYSRLLEFKNSLGMPYNRSFDRNDIVTLQNKYKEKDPYNIFNRYNDNLLLQLLNNM